MLTNRLAKEGDWLFRHRSYLPFIMLLPIGWSFTKHTGYLGGSHALQHTWEIICCAISWSGLLIRITTIGFVPGGTSGRNTRTQRATELNTTGWYSMTRNPLYLGNYIVGLGLVSSWLDPILILAYTVIFWLYYERIIAREEEFLSEQFGSAYRNWAKQTPVFIPMFKLWKRPAYPFCWRTALRREYSAMLLIGVGFQIIDLSQHLLIDRRFYLDRTWSIHLALCAVGYITLRTIKKHTTWLRAAGR